MGAEAALTRLTNGEMTKEELLKILEDNSGGSDPEIMHMRCDDALLDYINDLDVTAAFEKGTKWYA